MHAGPAETAGVEELVRRLAESVLAFEDLVRQQSDGGRAVVQALADQLAAGQGETLYGLRVATQAVTRGISELERTTAGLSDALAPRLTALVDELLETATGTARTTIAELRQELTAEALRTSSEFTLALQGGVAALHSATDVLSGEVAAVAAASVQTATAERNLSVTVGHALEEIAGASLAAAQAISGTASAARDDLARASVALVAGVEQAFAGLAADAVAVTEATGRVGENVVSRLIATLDDRDHRDKLLEDRLNARIDRLTTRVGDSVSSLANHLSHQVDRLEARDVAGREAMSQELLALVDRLLAEPRSSLRSLRAAAKQDDPTAVHEPAPREPRRKRAE